MRNLFSLALAAIICAACATPSLAADKQYCPGAKSIYIQQGDLSAIGGNREPVLADSLPIDEVSNAHDSAYEALPYTWTDLNDLGPLKMTCYSDDAQKTPMGKPVLLPGGTDSCKQDAKTKVVTCSDHPM